MPTPWSFPPPMPLRFPIALDPLQTAPLLCAGVIGFRSLKVSGVQPGEILGLFGFGASAHFTLQVALRWGCPVYVFSRDEDHRRHARELGARWAGPPEETPPAPLHAAITFAPSGQVVARALSRLRRGGTVAVNAVHMDALPPIPYRDLYHERALRSVANLTRSDTREFLGLALEEPFQAAVNVLPAGRCERGVAQGQDVRLPGLRRAERREDVKMDALPAHPLLRDFGRPGPAGRGDPYLLGLSGRG